jgi:hypothetical protein
MTTLASRSVESDSQTDPEFESIDAFFERRQTDRVIETLIERLRNDANPRRLLDALLLKARLDLGLTPLQTEALVDIPEPTREHYEERYLAAIRTVGELLLARGEIPAAWPYFQAIGDKEPVAKAIETYRHDPATADPEADVLGQIIEVAFNQGVHPKKGFELILDHYGVCSAITAFEHLRGDESLRTECASMLTRRLYDQLSENLRGDIANRGLTRPGDETATVAELIQGRDILFEDEAYHVDVSHLASVVRSSVLLADKPSIELAVELAEYGRGLSPRHKYEGLPPFEDVYADHSAYLKALLGVDVEAAIERFEEKARASAAESAERGYAGPTDSLPAQVLVLLLVRLGRLDRAIDVFASYLTEIPESNLACPSLSKLCKAAGRIDRLVTIAKDLGDLVTYAAARLELIKTEEADDRDDGKSLSRSERS